MTYQMEDENDTKNHRNSILQHHVLLAYFWFVLCTSESLYIVPKGENPGASTNRAHNTIHETALW